MLELAQLFGDRSELVQDRGPQAILLKGGHGEGAQSIDLLLETGREPVELASPRLPVTMRGTGCALSTAIAVELAKGNSLEKSCRVAKDYVWTLLRGCEVG
jgi:hydroxymethylpyrimidine/phosphomethylpyrimidine kinase